MALRIATFNCENLFSRSRILDFSFDDTSAEAAKAEAALKAGTELKKILQKKTFTATDKTKIISLIKQRKGFFTVEEDRGKLLSGNKVVATGGIDFVGHIRFITKDVTDEALKNTGKIIDTLNADVLCVVEVENRELLGHFNSQVPGRSVTRGGQEV